MDPIGATMSTAGIDSYCTRAATFWDTHGFDIVFWFLVAGLVLAVIAGVLAAVEKAVMLRKVNGADSAELRELAGGVDTGALQAISQLIDSLVRAPTWFALFLASIALIWVSAASMNTACRPSPPPESETDATPGETRDPLDEPSSKQRQ